MNTSKNGGQLYAVFALLTLVATTTLAFIPILSIGLLKLIPYKPWQAFCIRLVDKIAVLWCGCNNFYMDNTQKLEWFLQDLTELERKKSYLVIANHRSWLDIIVLQRAFNRKIPMLKFFIKDKLKWVPLLGFVWWAMGCPFMKRYSAQYLASKPHKKGKDLAATRKSIDLFKHAPTSIMNFVEGTRFTPRKKEEQASPYQNLLKPKAGGIGYVLSHMGHQIHSILDVTIVYPNKHYTLWDFLCRRIDSIKIHIRQLTIPMEFTLPNLATDSSLQQQFRDWLNQQWAQKDQLISSLQ